MPYSHNESETTMKRWNLNLLGVVVCSMTLLSGVATAQDAKAPAKDAAKDAMKQTKDAMKDKAKEAVSDAEKKAKEMMGGEMQMPPEMAPGEHHARLAKMAGMWNCAVKSWMAPGMPPEESKATAEMKMIMDGRFLQETFKGDMMGQPFTGMNILGYNGFTKKHTSVWIDSATTETTMMQGTCSEDGKVCTLEGEMTNPMTKQQMKSRIIVTHINDDQMKMEMFMPGPDGKDMKSMEIMYTRAK